ncbi:hypothetical protein CHARACLAT_007716 [Characodon lateralis]|uniref:Uncharacterized protein n=1 Tax=Characodon lateralis TaxID=208331 RepID=A0ABU7CZS5_9TELE|nr:hypothetical protein [Characodon lateralis]
MCPLVLPLGNTGSPPLPFSWLCRNPNIRNWAELLKPFTQLLLQPPEPSNDVIDKPETTRLQCCSSFSFSEDSI